MNQRTFDLALDEIQANAFGNAIVIQDLADSAEIALTRFLHQGHTPTEQQLNQIMQIITSLGAIVQETERRN